MGVKSLWQLLERCGQDTAADALWGKVLAVDISMWLHQIVKGMRTRDGGPLENAHIQGLITRLCFLLHHNIRPVFVFDGPAPALKQRTMAQRREKRDENQEVAKRANRMLLTNHLRRQLLGDTGDDVTAVLPKRKPDLFELPALTNTVKQQPE